MLKPILILVVLIGVAAIALNKAKEQLLTSASGDPMSFWVENTNKVDEFQTNYNIKLLESSLKDGWETVSVYIQKEQNKN